MNVLFIYEKQYRLELISFLVELWLKEKSTAGFSHHIQKKTVL
jgi:hypothetical protein